MKDTQLQRMNLKDLIRLKNRIENTIAQKRDKERTELRDKFRQLAAEKGISWTDIVGTGKAKPRGPVAAKYADPKDPTQTWSGRGRMPKWLSAKIKSGAKLESFKI